MEAKPLREALQAVRQAKIAAGALKMELLSTEDLDARLKELRASIPDETELVVSHTW